MGSRTFSLSGGEIDGTQTATTLASGTFTSMFTLTLPKGMWIITSYVNATTAFNEAFYCRMRKNTATLTRENLDGRGGGGISLASMTNSSGSDVIDLYVYQGSGSDKTIEGNLRAIRLR